MIIMMTPILKPGNWLFVLAFLSSSLVFTACEQDDPEPATNETITEEEMVDLLEGALVNGSEGLVAEMAAAAKVSDEALEKDLKSLECGETADSTVTRNFTNAYITSAYNSTWTWTLFCNAQNLPTEIAFGRSTEGTYETARLLSDDSATSDWSVSQLIFGPNYVINGSYEREGTQESKVRQMRSFTSQILITVDDVNIDKGEQQITSGIASFTLTGTGSEGGSFTADGDLVFNGDGTLTLIINGNSYVIDLN